MEKTGPKTETAKYMLPGQKCYSVTELDAHGSAVGESKVVHYFRGMMSAPGGERVEVEVRRVDGLAVDPNAYLLIL